MSIDTSIKKLGTRNTWGRCPKDCALYAVVKSLKEITKQKNMKTIYIALAFFAFTACKNTVKEEKQPLPPTKEETTIQRAKEIERKINKNLRKLLIYKQAEMEDSINVIEARLKALEDEQKTL